VAATTAKKDITVVEREGKRKVDKGGGGQMKQLSFIRGGGLRWGYQWKLEAAFGPKESIMHERRVTSVRGRLTWVPIPRGQKVRLLGAQPVRRETNSPWPIIDGQTGLKLHVWRQLNLSMVVILRNSMKNANESVRSA